MEKCWIREILCKNGSKLVLDKTKVDIFDDTETITKIREVIDNLVDFIQQNFNITLTANEAEVKLTEAIAYFDLDILYSFNGVSIKSEEKISNHDLFMVFSYFKKINETNSETFKYIQEHLFIKYSYKLYLF